MQNWKELDQMGFIPGITETEAEFLQRVNFCQNLRQELTQTIQADLPFDLSDLPFQEITHEAYLWTNELYGIRPEWILIFFNNHQLALWHGGCAWIFQITTQTPTAAFLQLRANFRHKSSYLGIYDRTELIAHELSHVGRMLYDEPQYEEILAYRSSKSKWRRFLGPIVQSSKESVLFVSVLALTLLLSFAALSSSSPLLTNLALWIPLLPLTLLGLALIRLIKKQNKFKHCLQNLTALFNQPQQADHLIYRLTDQEIQLFAQSTTVQIREYIHSQQESSFRWRFITSNFNLNS